MCHHTATPQLNKMMTVKIIVQQPLIAKNDNCNNIFVIAIITSINHGGGGIGVFINYITPCICI